MDSSDPISSIPAHIPVDPALDPTPADTGFIDPILSAPIHPSTLTTGTAPDGTPTLVHRTVPSSTTSAATKSDPPVTGLRKRVNALGSSVDTATAHPAVQRARDVAQQQVGRAREFLGRSQTVRKLESETGVDRVLLVAGGVFLYLLLVPLNLFGLALFTTTLLTLLPPAYLTFLVLEVDGANADDQRVKQLLAYFVVLGLVQLLESLAAGVLEKRIPQYYTVKLLFLAYLLHPKTKGAILVHEKVFKPLLAAAPTTSPAVPTAQVIPPVPAVPIVPAVPEAVAVPEQLQATAGEVY